MSKSATLQSFADQVEHSTDTFSPEESTDASRIVVLDIMGHLFSIRAPETEDVTWETILTNFFDPVQIYLRDSVNEWVVVCFDTPAWKTKGPEQAKRAQRKKRDFWHLPDPPPRDALLRLFYATANDDERQAVANGQLVDGNKSIAANAWNSWAARVRGIDTTKPPEPTDVFPWPVCLIQENPVLRKYFIDHAIRLFPEVVRLLDHAHVVFFGFSSLRIYGTLADRSDIYDRIMDRLPPDLCGEADLTVAPIAYALIPECSKPSPQILVHSVDSDLVIITASFFHRKVAAENLRCYLFRSTKRHWYAPLRLADQVQALYTPDHEELALTPPYFWMAALYFMHQTDLTEKINRVTPIQIHRAVQWLRQAKDNTNISLLPECVFRGDVISPSSDTSSENKTPSLHLWTFTQWLAIIGVAYGMITLPRSATDPDPKSTHRIGRVPVPRNDTLQRPSSRQAWWDALSAGVANGNDKRIPPTMEEMWPRYTRWVFAMIWSTCGHRSPTWAHKVALQLGFRETESKRFEHIRFVDTSDEVVTAAMRGIPQCITFLRGLFQEKDEEEEGETSEPSMKRTRFE